MTAGLINAFDITKRKPEDVKVVVNGAGAAAISCASLVMGLGVRRENIVMCDSKGVIYEGPHRGHERVEGPVRRQDRRAGPWPMPSRARTSPSACRSRAPSPQDMVKSMADAPIIFAMANPDPEITPEDAHAVRPDVIMGTGRSDYPNQVNNVLGFPYIFRGALDVQATEVNEEMKMAAAKALASLAREDVPEEVEKAYGCKLVFGPGYVIPTPFDPRLIEVIPPAVAKAAMETGVARSPISDWEIYRLALRTPSRPRAQAGFLVTIDPSGSVATGPCFGRDPRAPSGGGGLGCLKPSGWELSRHRRSKKTKQVWGGIRPYESLTSGKAAMDNTPPFA